MFDNHTKSELLNREYQNRKRHTAEQHQLAASIVEEPPARTPKPSGLVAWLVSGLFPPPPKPVERPVQQQPVDLKAISPTKA